ncbi:hypothetical protein P9112_012760 [Eukaryota sp. TZLM1-RC]
MKLAIIYGSETGNSEEFAEEIADHYGVEATEGNEFDIAKLPEVQNIIVVVGTAGDGEYPSNFDEFAESLEEEKPDLSKSKFAVFGLGSTSYDAFCEAAKKIQKVLKDLGASPLAVKSDNFGDDEDDDGYKTKGEPWFEELKTVLA